uniref:Uncharacterized protein n=1 Tax=Knipowitschia caucasica TaxID=637954 RepID=A0AAV2L517_KNICA
MDTFLHPSTITNIKLRSSPWTPHGIPSPSESLSVDSLRGLLSRSPSPPPAPHCTVSDSLRPDSHTPEELRGLPPWTPSPPPAPRRRLPQGNGSYIPRLMANRDVKLLANGQKVFTPKKQVDELKEEFQWILRRSSHRTVTCRRALHHMLDQVLEHLMQTVRRMQSSRHHQSIAPAPIRPTVFVPRPPTTPAPKSRRRIRTTPVHRGVPLTSTIQVHGTPPKF